MRRLPISSISLPERLKNHITNILSQLNLRNRTQIAILATSIRSLAKM